MKWEMRQLILQITFKPRHTYDLTNKEKAEVLEYHMILKLNRDGKIKVITVSGGNKQRHFISKEYSILPIVATEAVLLTCSIDTQEAVFV